MSKPIEDYGFIGNRLSCALVGRDGSIDWLCLPRFDSDACFAALLGNENNGFWRLAPVGDYRVTRRYRDGTTILETTFETAEGAVTLIDFMPLSDDENHVDVMRLVRGDRGRVPMRMELVLRFGYGEAIPWLRRRKFGLSAVAGPDGAELHTQVPLKNDKMRTDRRVHRGGGDFGLLRALLSPVLQAARARRRCRGAARRDRGVVARMERARPLQRWRGPQVVRRRLAFADHAEGADLLAQRRHRRGGDDVAAGTTRRRAQLGLSLLLDPRRDDDALRAVDVGLPGRGARVAPLDAARHRRESAAVADHVRPRRRAAAA